MTRQRKMVELVLRTLKDASASAERARTDRALEPRTREQKARIILAVAVDDALADLEHALSESKCNHGACVDTTLTDGSPAHEFLRADE